MSQAKRIRPYKTGPKWYSYCAVGIQCPSKLYIIGFQPHKCHATAHGHVIVHAAVAIMTLIRVCPSIIVHAQYAGCKGELYTEILNSTQLCPSLDFNRQVQYPNSIFVCHMCARSSSDPVSILSLGQGHQVQAHSSGESYPPISKVLQVKARPST